MKQLSSTFRVVGFASVLVLVLGACSEPKGRTRVPTEGSSTLSKAAPLADQSIVASLAAHETKPAPAEADNRAEGATSPEIRKASNALLAAENEKLAPTLAAAGDLAVVGSVADLERKESAGNSAEIERVGPSSTPPETSVPVTASVKLPPTATNLAASPKTEPRRVAETLVLNNGAGAPSEAASSSAAEFAAAWAAYDRGLETAQPQTAYAVQEPSRSQRAFAASEEADDVWAMIRNGTVEWRGRYRFEDVDDNDFNKHAHASTLRASLLYRSAIYRDFQAVVEAEFIAALGNELYNSTSNGVTNRPLIADPTGSDLNQAFVQYLGWDHFDLRVGRQRLALGNERFFGPVGWRQNDQSFDALVLDHQWDDADLSYTYIANANRVFGPDSALGDERMDTHLFDASYQFEDARVAAYFYRVNAENTPTFSTATVGARLDINGPQGDDWGMFYGAEVAQQTDARDNPNSVNANYLHLSARLEFPRYTLSAGYEQLGGSTTAGDKFTTPFATVHKFNGWADKFAVTPDGGLEDIYLSGTTDWNGNELTAAYHLFAADVGGNYGSEVDLMLRRPINEHVTVGLKTAFYASDGFADDTNKLWFWVDLKP